MRRTVAVLPTYQEAGNIAGVVEKLLSLGVDGLEVVVVDDASPDGTAERARRAGAGVLERRGPRGRGLAGREGFLFALEKGADLIVEMDADFSHRPDQVPRLLDAMDDCDVAVGSRTVAGGRDERSPLRRALTRATSAYARVVLGVGVGDPNSGFRCFRRSALEAVEPATLRSRGPSIIHETLFRAVRAGLRVKEVPIDFGERRKGDSKLDVWRLAAGCLWILRLRLGL